MRRLPLTLAGLAILVTATACSAGSDSADHSAHEGHETSASSSATSQAASSPASGTPSASQGGHAHGQEHMHAMDGGPAPEGIAAAEKPTYPVGTEVTLTTDRSIAAETVDVRGTLIGDAHDVIVQPDGALIVGNATDAGTVSGVGQLDNAGAVSVAAGSSAEAGTTFHLQLPAAAVAARGSGAVRGGEPPDSPRTA